MSIVVNNMNKKEYKLLMDETDVDVLFEALYMVVKHCDFTEYETILDNIKNQLMDQYTQDGK